MDRDEFHSKHRQEEGWALFFLSERIELLAQQLHTIMATLDQVLKSVADETALDDSIITLLNGIEQQLKDALSGATLPPAVQAKVDAVFDNAEANKAKVAAAIAANTPPTS